jgi:hypothetical protein
MMIKIVVLCTVKDLKEVHFIHCSLKVALMGLSKTVSFSIEFAPQENSFRFVSNYVYTGLCVCWESSFYEKWWPKLTFPSFRVLEAKCLQKFRIDEQICLLRVKAPWPLTDREAVLQFFVFEYFKDDLVIILLNSIEVESGSVAEVNAVRIDFVGGVAIQKVTPEKSYIR